MTEQQYPPTGNIYNSWEPSAPRLQWIFADKMWVLSVFADFGESISAVLKEGSTHASLHVMICLVRSTSGQGKKRFDSNGCGILGQSNYAALLVGRRYVLASRCISATKRDCISPALPVPLVGLKSTGQI